MVPTDGHSSHDDSKKGWDTLPLMGSGEFYLEYGDIDYEVTVTGI